MSARLNYAEADSIEFICLECVVPGGCDENHPACRYRQLKPQPEQIHYTAGQRCATCGTAITNGARWCVRCRPQGNRTDQEA